jgi:hypothetical protein
MGMSFSCEIICCHKRSCARIDYATAVEVQQFFSTDLAQGIKLMLVAF